MLLNSRLRRFFSPSPPSDGAPLRPPIRPARPKVSPAFDRVAAYSWRFLVIVAAVAVGVYALVQLRLIVIPVIVALFVSTILAPPAHWLSGRGVPHLLSTWIVMLAAIGIFAGAVALIAPQVASEVGQMGEDVRRGSEQAIAWLTEGPLNLTEQQIDRFVEQAAQRIRDNSSTLAQGALAGAVRAIEIVAATILMIVITFFFVKDGRQMWAWITKHFSESHRRDVNECGARAWTTLSAYVRGTALIALVDALLIGIALVLVGVPLVLPLALLTFFGGFFPVVGAFVAGLVAVLVALATSGVVDALIIGIVITAIQQIEGDVLQPMILGRAVKLHPIVVLLSLTAGGILAGVAGAFLAVPIAAVAATVGNYLVNRTPARAVAAPG
jgi:predicted PurR-regulated permease PerM